MVLQLSQSGLAVMLRPFIQPFEKLISQVIIDCSESSATVFPSEEYHCYVFDNHIQRRLTDNIPLIRNITKLEVLLSNTSLPQILSSLGIKIFVGVNE